MLRKKTVRNMEPRYVYMLDSAYYHICPPAGGASHRKKKPSLQAFMEHVLCEDLNKTTLQRADNVLKIFDWNDPQVCPAVEVHHETNSNLKSSAS